jgi:hypothetical protein
VGTVVRQEGDAGYHADGEVRNLGGYLRVLSDRRAAAGADEEFLLGHAVVWTGR